MGFSCGRSSTTELSRRFGRNISVYARDSVELSAATARDLADDLAATAADADGLREEIGAAVDAIGTISEGSTSVTRHLAVP